MNRHAFPGKKEGLSCMLALFEKLDKVKPFYDAMDKVVMFICKLMLVSDILITSLSVAGRYIPFIPDPAWTEEIVLTLMAYMAVLSAALAIRRQSHIRMTAFDKYMNRQLLNCLDIVADICVLILGVVMVTQGWKFATGIGGKGYYTSMPTLSKFWMYFPVPVAGVAMVIFELEQIYNHFKLFFIKDEKKEDKMA